MGLMQYKDCELASRPYNVVIKTERLREDLMGLKNYVAMHNVPYIATIEGLRDFPKFLQDCWIEANYLRWCISF